MNYVIPHQNLTFSDYRARCIDLITEKRKHWQHQDHAHVVEMNAPFEYRPTPSQPTYDIGVLYAHGLLESPYSFREFAAPLANASVLCRSILLPGHGTDPRHLMHVSENDWIETMHYGIESMRPHVKRLYLMGYSTGAALALYHALTRDDIAGVVLIAPAIQINLRFYSLFHALQQNAPIHWFQNAWVRKLHENDYVKYRSIAYHSVHEVWKLGLRLNTVLKEKPCHLPIWMSLSENDETISAPIAIDI